MTGTTDVLDLIDAAVEDWETSPDAVRYNGPAPTNPAAATGVTFAEACANMQSLRSWLAPRSSPFDFADASLTIGDHEITVPDLHLEGRWFYPGPVTLGMLGISADVEQQMATLTQDERDEFMDYWRASPWGLERAWEDWTARRTTETTRVTLTAHAGQFTASMAALRDSLKEFVRAFSRKPCGAKECLCHPSPFPAARDYRRRTKHRNQRRKS